MISYEIRDRTAGTEEIYGIKRSCGRSHKLAPAVVHRHTRADVNRGWQG